MKNKSVGILGGSFNPIHNDHIKIALESLKNRFIDEVWLIPNNLHPFDKNLISIRKRINMINIAIKPYQNIKICDIELNDNSFEKSYTVNTIKKLKQKYPDTTFYFILGSDNLNDLEKWFDFEYLKNNVEFIIYERGGYNIPEELLIKVKSIIRNNVSNISSTLIRKNLSQGKSIKNLVSPDVEKYLHTEGLYQNEK